MGWFGISHLLLINQSLIWTDHSISPGWAARGAWQDHQPSWKSQGHGRTRAIPIQEDWKEVQAG